MVFIIPASAWALWNWYEKDVQALPIIGKTNDHRVSGFNLVNQDRKQITIADWSNKIVVADFFFTHCPVVCPKMTRSIKRVQARFNAKDWIIFSSFSVDPERDSSAQLKKYQHQFNIDTRNWHLLTGEKKDIYKLARNSFMVVATDGDGGPEDFIHSESLVLIDQKQRIRGYYNGTIESEVDQLIRDIKKLQNEE